MFWTTRYLSDGACEIGGFLPSWSAGGGYGIRSRLEDICKSLTISEERHSRWYPGCVRTFKIGYISTAEKGFLEGCVWGINLGHGGQICCTQKGREVTHHSVCQDVDKDVQKSKSHDKDFCSMTVTKVEVNISHNNTRSRSWTSDMCEIVV